MNTKQELLRKASKINDIQEFCNIAYEILGNPIFIEDRSGVTLGFSANAKTDAPEWSFMTSGSMKKAPSAKQIHELDELFQKAYEKGEAVIIREDNYMKTPRMMLPLMIQQEHAGTMVCGAHCKEFEEDDICLFEILASFACTIIYNHKYVISGKHNRIDNFLIKLLLGTVMPSNSIRTHLGDLQWTGKPYHYIVILCPRSLEDVPAMPLYEITEVMQQQKGLHAFIFDNRVTCICSSEKPVDDWQSSFPILASALQKYQMFAGSSQSFENPSMMQHYYRQALEICKLAGLLQRDNYFYSYNDYSVFLLLSQVEKDYDLRSYCHEKILFLEEYDNEHNTDLLPTLHCFLESGCSMGKTASQLYVHRNTINYRIQKCYEILECDFEDPDFFFASIFSMHILEYENKKAGKMPHFSE